MARSESYRAVWWSLGAAALAGSYASTRRTRGFEHIAEELRSGFSRFRSPSIGPLLLPLMQAATRKPSPSVDGVDVEARQIDGPDGDPLTIYIYRPAGLQPGASAMLYTHGGGMIIGSAPAYHDKVSAYARDLGMLVVSADYRLAPQHPFPAPLDDVHAAYCWLVGSADTLDVDARRLVVAGDSGGGGLTAALCLRLRDESEPLPAFQLLIYPMLDDRTGTPPADDITGQIVWTRDSNRFGWSSYLGYGPGLPNPAPYAVPARHEDLAGLPPAWIGVGTLDLFHDEDVEYARRLRDAGVACELLVVDGAFHGFDIYYPDSLIAKSFRNSALNAVRQVVLMALKDQTP